MTMGLGLFIIGIAVLIWISVLTTAPAEWKLIDTVMLVFLIFILILAFILGYWHAIGLGFVVTYR